MDSNVPKYGKINSEEWLENYKTSPIITSETRSVNSMDILVERKKSETNSSINPGFNSDSSCNYSFVKNQVSVKIHRKKRKYVRQLIPLSDSTSDLDSDKNVGKTNSPRSQLIRKEVNGEKNFKRNSSRTERFGYVSRNESSYTPGTRGKTKTIKDVYELSSEPDEINDVHKFPNSGKVKDFYELSSSTEESDEKTFDTSTLRLTTRRQKKERKPLPFSKTELKYLHLGYKKYHGDFKAILRGYTDYFRPTRTQYSLRNKWRQLCKIETKEALALMK